MSENNFDLIAENAIQAIMEKMENAEGAEDMELDLINGVLQAGFEDGSKIIINKQSPARQIWLASPLGPAHFSFDAESQSWRDDRSGEVLERVLERAMSQKLGTTIRLD